MKSRKNFKIKNNINNYYKKNKVINKNIGPKLSSYKLKKSDYQKENIKKIQNNSNFKLNKIEEDLKLNNISNKNQINVTSNDNICEIDKEKNVDLIVKRLKKLIKKSKKMQKKIEKLLSINNNLNVISYEG